MSDAAQSVKEAFNREWKRRESTDAWFYLSLTLICVFAGTQIKHWMLKNLINKLLANKMADLNWEKGSIESEEQMRQVMMRE